MNCPLCHRDYVGGERLIANKTETFTFKPATVDDVKIYTVGPGGERKEVSAGATLSPDELKELRKDHKKTEVATVFISYREGAMPEGLFNVRHAVCVVQRTAVNKNHPMLKHAMRFQRMAKR